MIFKTFLAALLMLVLTWFAVSASPQTFGGKYGNNKVVMAWQTTLVFLLIIEVVLIVGSLFALIFAF